MAVAGKRKPTSRNVHDVGLNDDSIVGVFGLTASYSLLLGRLTSKLADVLVVGVAGFEPTTSSSRTKRATKLRHTPCAAGDSIASTHRGEEIGSAESSVTSAFAPRGNPVGPRRPPCQAAHGRPIYWPAPRSALTGPGPHPRAHHAQEGADKVKDRAA